MWAKVWLAKPGTKEEAKKRMVALKNEFEKLKENMGSLPTEEELAQKKAEERERKKQARESKKTGKKEGGL